MKITVSKSKNATLLYLTKSVRINGKSTTKTIEKLGSLEEVQKRAGKIDAIEWAKAYAAKRTAEEKKSSKDIIVKYSSSLIIDKNIRNSCNIGYLFLQDIYYSLGLDKICSLISQKYNFDYDLNEIFSILVYSRIISPGSKLSSFESAKNFIEQPKCELHQIYRALEVIAKENDFFQSQLYKNSQNVINRKNDVIYYDCTNYYFEIEDEDDFRKYGVSKEHRPNPIVQMGMFMDADGIPLAFSLFDGNQNEQNSMTPLEKKIIKDFEASEFIVCTDAGLSSMTNRKYNNLQGRKFVTTQSVKKLKNFLQDFCLEDNGWRLLGDTQTYKISEIDEELNYNKIFYKERWINENGLEQRLIVTYSPKYCNYQKNIRQRQIQRASKFVERPSKLHKRNSNDPKRFIEQEHCTIDGEVASRTITSLNFKQIENEAKYDGIYAVCTNLECDISKIISINKKRWEIEECFRIMKTEFKARPVYLSRKDRITAHFISCFTALVIYRILEQKVNYSYTSEELIKTLRTMDMMILPGDGYVPAYTRTDITDALHEAFGFRTDNQITSQQKMRKILNHTKKA